MIFSATRSQTGIRAGKHVIDEADRKRRLRNLNYKLRNKKSTHQICMSISGVEEFCRRTTKDSARIFYGSPGPTDEPTAVRMSLNIGGERHILLVPGRAVFVKRKCELLTARRHVLAVQCVICVCSRDRWRRTEREWEIFTKKKNRLEIYLLMEEAHYF
ncbi:hypothetical protein PUN28_009633 [Cardiocondyla obscurior]|uniref:Uncharacterized protein n=1 Tax=Cardiocondyla obscurior TaxID=286306 RepID=A0AAW2FV57_9HYME